MRFSKTNAFFLTPVILAFSCFGTSKIPPRTSEDGAIIAVIVKDIGGDNKKTKCLLDPARGNESSPVEIQKTRRVEGHILDVADGILGTPSPDKKRKLYEFGKFGSWIS